MNRIDQLINNWRIEKVMIEDDWTITGRYKDCDPYGDVNWDFVELDECHIDLLPKEVIQNSDIIEDIRVWKWWFVSCVVDDKDFIKSSLNIHNFNFINK